MNIYLTKIAGEMSDYKAVAEKLKTEFLGEINEYEKKEHTQGSVPGTAFQGKETAEEEAREVAETAANAGKVVGEEMGPELAEKAAALRALLKSAEMGSEQRSNGSGIAAAVGGIAAGAYGNRVLNRAKLATKVPGANLGLGQAVKQTLGTDLSSGISKIRGLGRRILARRMF